MDLSRRSFIRWVLAGGAAAACPFPVSAGGKKGSAAVPPGELHSETNEVCHKVRDGAALPLPGPDERCDVVVVGGGPSGLAAADELKSADFRLLEKEDHVGGNAYSESWQGCAYSTGAAWDSIPDADFKGIAQRFKFDWKQIKGVDSACFDGVWIRDFWNGRADNPAIDRLPYGKDVKDGFRKFLTDIQPVDLDAQKDKLDAKTFGQVLEGYPPQIKKFWDAFGQSNWGADCDRSSAYVGVQAARDWFKLPRYTWEGGIGIASKRVYDGLPESARRKIRTKAVVYKVRREGKRALVSFFEDGKPRTIEAKAVVMATPKFVTKFIVDGLPKDQYDAMAAMRYAPFMVFNLCFDRVVYNQGYDNWTLDAKYVTDFVPADWVTHADQGDLGRKQVITVYSPLRENERADVLDDEDSLTRARRAAEELVTMFPGWLEHLREVRAYRRGHPMPMSTPGYLTKLQPIARRDLAPIYFAHCDVLGEVSDWLFAALSGIKAAQKAAKHV